jgi:hypothetical protein
MNAGPVALYRVNAQLETLDLGECDYPRALEVFEECYRHGLQVTSGEEAMSRSTFGLSRSDEDFIEVSCNGPDSVSVHSDRICYPTAWSRLLAFRRRYWITGVKDDGIEVIRSFFEESRVDFERRYARFLCFK